MDDFRVPPASYFDQRPDTGATGARKRRKPKGSQDQTPPEQDDIVLSPEPDEPGEEQSADYYSPSGEPEKND